MSICLLLSLNTALAAPPKLTPAVPSIIARAYFIQDHNSGYVIAEKRADERMEPASLTKLMTAYVVFSELESGSIQLSDQVLVSEKAWRMPGSRMFIEVNKEVSLENLLKGLIIQSGNDASVALAEHVAGSEDAFAALMNQHAQALGMTGTHFVNSAGLPDKDHYTTARDMARLANALIRQFPDHYQWYSTREFTFNGITQYNRNKLLWRDKSVDGIKTGFTDSAGYCLVTSAQRNGMRLVSVVLGAKSEEGRAQESQKLLNYAFRFFETHRLYSANKTLSSARIWKGEVEQLPLGVSDDLYVTIPRGQYAQLASTINVKPSIVAPAVAGQNYGTLSIKLNGEGVAERPLVALRSVGEGGVLQRLIDEVMLLLD
ncbi:MAG: D-alanyl-D-alanine carboxypeptidase [Gammaproteobacteria bacterium]|nr:D-alanyl-D-alanine carboxypeptidase [Gammaproteobacteria bacterium]